MSDGPDVIFASEEATKDNKRRKRRVKVRGYASKPDLFYNNLSWFFGGLVTGCLIMVLGGFLAFQIGGGRTAFGPGSEQQPAASVDRRVEQVEAIREAASFLASRLNAIEIVSGEKPVVLWEVVNPRFGEIWTWCEQLPQPDQSAIQTCYRVDPLDLDYRTTTQNLQFRGERVWALLVECHSEDCIVARTATMAPDGSEVQGTVVTERQERIRWFYESQNDALRSATAARRLLGELGSERSRF